MNTNYFTYLLIFAMLLWGGGWSALKVLTQTQPMDTIVFWRFFLMSLSFLPILYFLKIPIHITKRNFRYIIMSSILNIAFMIFSYLGIKNGLAGAGSVIITTLSPIITIILTIIFFKKRLIYLQAFGIFFGLLGGFIMLELNDISLFLSSDNIYFLIAAVIWAGITILAQYSHLHIHPIHYSFAISVVATIVSFIYVFNSNFLSVLDEGYLFWFSLLYLAIFGQTIATTIFFMASGKLGSQKTSSFMFLVPFFALFIAWIVLDEEMQLHIIIGGILSVIAVFFINKKGDI